jgi:predicted metal-dependent hydrolase
MPSSIEVMDRLIYMLRKDGVLFRWETGSNGWRYLFGEGGFLCATGADYRSWFRRGFHPDDIDDRPLIEENIHLVDSDLRRA